MNEERTSGSDGGLVILDCNGEGWASIQESDPRDGASDFGPGGGLGSLEVHLLRFTPLGRRGVGVLEESLESNSVLGGVIHGSLGLAGAGQGHPIIGADLGLGEGEDIVDFDLDIGLGAPHGHFHASGFIPERNDLPWRLD